jgi:hypothetical protein
MSTFLELAQKVGSESGTVDKTIASVVGATGRIGKVVRWTNDAYRSIQNADAAWRWLQSDFSAALTIGQGRYTAAQLGIATRFAEWPCLGVREDRYSVYPTDGNGAGEYSLRFVDWPTFYTTRLRGVQTAGNPAYFSISSTGEIVVSPAPDRAFTLRGPYRKGPQELIANGDIPEMPARFHDIIVDGALILLTTHDEAAPTISLYQLRKLRGFSDLQRDQLPVVAFGGGTLA